MAKKDLEMEVLKEYFMGKVSSEVLDSYDKLNDPEDRKELEREQRRSEVKLYKEQVIKEITFTPMIDTALDRVSTDQLTREAKHVMYQLAENKVPEESVNSAQHYILSRLERLEEADRIEEENSKDNDGMDM